MSSIDFDPCFPLRQWCLNVFKIEKDQQQKVFLQLIITCYCRVAAPLPSPTAGATGRPAFSSVTAVTCYTHVVSNTVPIYNKC